MSHLDCIFSLLLVTQSKASLHFWSVKIFPWKKCRQKEAPPFAPINNSMQWLTCFPRSPPFFKNVFLDAFWVISRAPCLPPPSSLYTPIWPSKYGHVRRMHGTRTDRLHRHRQSPLHISQWTQHFSFSSQVCSSRLHIGHAGVDNQVCYMRNSINMVSSAVSMEPCREEEKQLMPAVNQNQCSSAENVTMLLYDSRGDCCSRCCCCSSSSFPPNLDLASVLLFDDGIISG